MFPVNSAEQDCTVQMEIVVLLLNNGGCHEKVVGC
jgi:hypothetical protein